jgi:hypothetical protein
MKKLRLGLFILIGLSTATIARAVQDVGQHYWILKKKAFDQTSTATPAANPAPFQFSSVVERAAGGQLNGNSFVLPPPNGVVHSNRQYTVASDGSLRYEAYFGNGSQQNLDTALAAGFYHLELIGTAGVHRAVDLNLTGNNYPAEIPKLTNSPFNNGQLVLNAAAPNTLMWNSFADHDFFDDVIILTITTSSRAVVYRKVLPASALSQSFPANFFTPENSYIAELTFFRVSYNDPTTISGSIGLAGFAATTKIFISTSSRTPVSGFANISTRGFIGTGENVLICGFIINPTNTTSKVRVVLRAIGPSLANAGIATPLPDPTITLLDGNQHFIASNDDWRTSPGAGMISAAKLGPTDNRESALVQDLPAGNYTAIVSGKNNATGIGLAEVYNLGSDGNAKLANISTRGQVLTGEKLLIGGLITVGPGTHKIVFRAIGPSLANQVAGALTNPGLELVNGQGATIAFNDDWKDTQQAEIQATGLQPTDDKESAIVSTLTSGNYSAIVRGRNNHTGVAVVEAYIVN